MSSNRSLMNPAVASGAFGMKAAIAAREVLGSAFDRDDREGVWRGVNVYGSLQVVAELLARLDSAIISDTRMDVERAWVGALGPELREALEPLIAADHRGLISPRGLMQCAREVILSAPDDDTLDPVSSDDLTRCLLGTNTEHDHVSGQLEMPEIRGFDAESVAQIKSVLDGLSEEGLRELMRTFAVDEVATLAYEKPETIETLLPHLHDVWRRPWPQGTKVDRLTGESPAMVFEAAFGVPFDDVLAFGRLIIDRATTGHVRFTTDELRAAGVPDRVLTHVEKHMVISLTDLRQSFRDEEEQGLVTAWSRFTVQRYPLVRLPDGALLLLRAQMGAQRIFGDLPFFDLREELRTSSPRAGRQFEQAMNDIFEARVGEGIRRIAAQPHLHDVAVATEPVMQKAWTTPGASGPPSVCDFVMVRGRYCVVVDASNRRLIAPLSEGQGDPNLLDGDIERNLLEHKFTQLASTIKLLADNGWPGDGSRITADTIFVPLVVTPDAGLPYSEFVDFQISERAHAILSPAARYVAPPALITVTDLMILEGLADHMGGDPVKILADWRALAGRGIPIRLQNMLDLFGLPARPMPRRAVGRMRRLSAELRLRLAPHA
ncbi:hypothetical protein [Rhodococcus sp. IEGM 1307]|uniref:hypothetical protein n=1 Tax=Rhodococcus sp. IEGM 1307 TaxID=3047091 RepID=UPI0024B703F0|nr:hypothetical protein [Rhodococcus sp. IEGM 1307]MDI9979817.1 hypothetical protein [Rhodococcus sp. IEGM 1307]